MAFSSSIMYTINKQDKQKYSKYHFNSILQPADIF